MNTGVQRNRFGMKLSKTRADADFRNGTKAVRADYTNINKTPCRDGRGFCFEKKNSC